MNLFKKIKKEPRKTYAGSQTLEKSVLDSVVRFAEQIKGPEAEKRLAVRLIEHMDGKSSSRRKKSAPYYLQFFAEDSREGCLNAGYAAGQTVSYMAFRGLAASVLRTVPEWMEKNMEDGSVCMAVLEFGGQDLLRHKNTDWQNGGCVHVESKEHWSEEILDFIKKQGLIGTEFTHVVFREGCLHFLLKTSARKNPRQAAVDAGILIANIMAAAEELWIDLDFVKLSEITEAGYLLSVCRRKEEWECRPCKEALVMYA